MQLPSCTALHRATVLATDADFQVFRSKTISRIIDCRAPASHQTLLTNPAPHDCASSRTRRRDFPTATSHRLLDTNPKKSATMPPAREILDSEDEGSDFSPVRRTIGDDRHAIYGEVTIIEQLTACDKPHHETAHVDVDVIPNTNVAKLDSGESTDLSFFQHVYDEQRHVTTSGNHSVARQNPRSSDITDLQLPAKASSSLTSVTDPAPPSLPRTKKTYAAKDVADLSQVTTPGRVRAVGEVESDPWCVSSSPPGGRSSATKELSKVARTYGKRKRERTSKHQSSSMPPTQDPYDFPSTQEQGAKRVRRRETQSPRGEVLISAGQVEDVVSTGMTPRRSGESVGLVDGRGEVVPETAPGLGVYIAPSAFTTSQKEEYLLVSLSPDTSEVGEPSLPSMGAGEVYNSSGTATVVFSTPSAYRSSAKEVPPTGELPSVEEVDEGSEMVGGAHPASSPDVISEEPAKRKRGRPPKKALEELPPLLETRSAKKRNVVRDEEGGCDGPVSPWNSNGEKTGRGGARRCRASDGLHDTTEIGTFIDLTAEADKANAGPDCGGDQATGEDVETEIAPEPKKKRGRKKKGVFQDPGYNMAESEAEVTKASGATHVCVEVDEPESKPPKKRRGRPRKFVSQLGAEQDISTQNAPAEPDPASAGFVPDGLAEPGVDKLTLAKPGKRGRKKKQDTVEPTNPAADEEEPAPAPPALSEISRNSQRSQVDEINASDDDDDGYDEDTKENLQPSPKKTGPSEIPKVRKHVPSVEDGENKAEKNETVRKSVVTASPATAATATTKVQYRVGLSKKSRIAPLLKSLRK